MKSDHLIDDKFSTTHRGFKSGTSEMADVCGSSGWEFKTRMKCYEWRRKRNQLAPAAKSSPAAAVAPILAAVQLRVEVDRHDEPD